MRPIRLLPLALLVAGLLAIPSTASADTCTGSLHIGEPIASDTIVEVGQTHAHGRRAASGLTKKGPDEARRGPKKALSRWIACSAPPVWLEEKK